MKPPGSYRACLIDALGTTVALDPPWERIDPALIAGLPPQRVRDAFAAEMSYYAANAHRASDGPSLTALRERCARLLSDGLGREVSVAELMASIRFHAYPDTAPALRALREGGLRIICVSNWDFELADVLATIGLAEAFDAVVVSALAGARKPDPAIFRSALEVAGCTAAEAIHVGDSDDDVTGARAAAIDVLRIGRCGGGDVASLAELPRLLLPPAAGGPPPGAISEH